MIFHYFKLARKNLIKNRYYTIINVVGLVFGMLSALIIAKYLGGSKQFDSFHEKKNSIYSINQSEFSDGKLQNEKKSTYLGVAEFLVQIPELIDYTKYYKHVESLVIAEQESGEVVSFTEGGVFITDSNFFEIFTFPFIQGDKNTALDGSNSIVLTKSSSTKYFGNTHPIGNTLTIRTTWGQENTYTVSGVIEDIPKLSRFQFDFLLTQAELNDEELWTVPDYSLFILLKENINPNAVGQKITNILENVPQLKAANKKLTISFESISGVPFSITDFLLLTVGIFVIFISWINYINQIIAQSYWRIKEVGVLRIMGATKFDLQIQFVIESSLICFISFVLIIVIYLLIEQPMMALTNGHLLPLFNDPTPINLAMLLIFGIGVVLAALIPTLLLLSQDFGDSLRIINSTKISSIGLRRALVVFQFSVSTVLLISIFVISDQLEYLQTKDKGLDIEQVIVVKAAMAKDTTFYAKSEILKLFKERCAEVPIVTHVASSTTVPGEEYRRETFMSFEGIGNKALIHQNGVDDQFFRLYGGELISGNDFIPDAIAKNKSSIIINESAAKALGISDFQKAINSKIIDYEDTSVDYTLIGIVKDFHQTSLKYEVRPLAFKYNITRGHSSLRIRRTGLHSTEFAESISKIEQIWNESYPSLPFDYFFLEEQFAAQDEESQHFGIFFKYFTALSILISCLGLYGLSLTLSVKRRKEIGIRKVLGASSTEILILYLKSYLGAILIAFIIGCPLAYILMEEWLAIFAYKVEIASETILLASISLMIIFLGTVSYHTVKSSMTNPVNVLKE